MADVEDRNTPAFEPKSAVGYASHVALQAGAVGFVVSSVQNALGKHSHGAMGVLTRTGGTIGFFAAMGATFAFTETIVANQRQKKDAVSGAAGACAAGFLAGIKSRSIPSAIGGCVVMGAIMGAFDYSGNLFGEVLSKEERRARFFKTPPKPFLDTAETADSQ
ncbi:unnamed protein product [Cyclocybe aegerita]|uniref:NADH dehydrogenase [ubiquinone] 1 alpha subcomplex subunit 11 n=1 Tax=Cyclocybe aegerita TaxID=1973307 RepID=A0A8S0VST9_CYCAE|nr:unnamed protein product [Cyclocybe aegerita]